MKKAYLFLLPLLATQAVHAQAKRDSLIIRQNNCWISIGMRDFHQPYDSVFKIRVERLQKHLSQIESTTGLPPDIRYIIAANGAEFLRYYNEPEPETELWVHQVESMQDPATMQHGALWKCRVADLQSGINFVLVAQDSQSMRRLLRTSLSGNHSLRMKMIEEAQSPTSDPWLVSIDESGGDPIVRVKSHKLERYGFRAFTGPMLFGDQLAVGFGSEMHRVWYRGASPSFRIGLSAATYFSNFSGEPNRWNTLTILQAKLVRPREADQAWYGIKIGVGGLDAGRAPLIRTGQVPPSGSSGSVSIPFVSIGFSLENTPLVDFDLDFLLLRGDGLVNDSWPGLQHMLSLKLPF